MSTSSTPGGRVWVTMTAVEAAMTTPASREIWAARASARSRAAPWTRPSTTTTSPVTSTARGGRPSPPVAVTWRATSAPSPARWKAATRVAVASAGVATTSGSARTPSTPAIAVRTGSTNAGSRSSRRTVAISGTPGDSRTRRRTGPCSHDRRDDRVDQGRAGGRQRPPQLVDQLVRRRRPGGRYAQALGQRHEVDVGPGQVEQVAGVRPRRLGADPIELHVQDGVGAVVEDDRHHVEALARLGPQRLQGEHGAAV